MTTTTSRSGDALVPAPAWRGRAWRVRARDGDVVVHAGADLACLLPDVPDAEARVPVELFEPATRGSARSFDPERLTAPVRAHLSQIRSSGALRPAGLPRRDEPLNVGAGVVGAEPAGLGTTLSDVDVPGFAGTTNPCVCPPG